MESIGEGPQKVVAEQQVLVVQETSTSGEERSKVRSYWCECINRSEECDTGYDACENCD